MEQHVDGLPDLHFCDQRQFKVQVIVESAINHDAQANTYSDVFEHTRNNKASVLNQNPGVKLFRPCDALDLRPQLQDPCLIEFVTGKWKLGQRTVMSFSGQCFVSGSPTP